MYFLYGQQTHFCYRNESLSTRWGKNNEKTIYFKSISNSQLFPQIYPSFWWKLKWSNHSIKRFAHSTKLPIIQMVIFQLLGFYGYDGKQEQAVNLLFLARMQSLLIKSLSGLQRSRCRQLSLERRAPSSALHFDVFIIVIAAGWLTLHYW